MDGASLGLFRLAFGAILTWEVLRYAQAGWIAEYFVAPSVHFTYQGFGWVAPWSAAGMQLHFAALGVAALCLALGLASRLSALLFTLLFGYVFLLEQARYLNHFYLVILLGGLLATLPAGHALSLRSLWRGRRAVPAWSVLLLRTQLGLVYVCAGLAKLNEDWLAGEPLRDWLARRDDVALIGPLLTSDAAPLLMSYGALAVDLLAWPGLARPRWRMPTYLVLVSFHLLNSALFGIGIFPWLMIAATTLFFEPDWPRRLGRRLWARRPAGASDGDGSREEPSPAEPSAAELTPPGPVARRAILGALAVYLGLQAAIPLRHHLYPGRPSWTEEGHAFAWHMKLRDKDSQIVFALVDPASGARRLVDPAHELTDWQLRKLGGRPDMIVQYAQRLRAREVAAGRPQTAVHATAMVSLNGRPAQLLIDPTVDLGRVERSWRHDPWILPLAPRP